MLKTALKHSKTKYLRIKKKNKKKLSFDIICLVIISKKQVLTIDFLVYFVYFRN